MYESGFRQGLQQKSARSRPYVNTIPITGKSKRFNKITKSEAVPITTRFGTTNPNELEYDYRTLFIQYFKDAKRVDQREARQLGEIGGPQTAIMQAQLMAANRNFDQTLVNGLLGNAYEGENGTSAVALPTTNDIPVNFITGGTGSNSDLTFDKILRISEIMGLNNISGQDIEGNSNVILLCTHKQLTTLRSTEKWTSYFYQDRKPLAGDGQFPNVLDVKIVALDANLLPYDAATGIRTCVAYSKEHVMFGMAQDFTTSVDRLVDGNLDWQLYAQWGWGATRIYDEGVIRVYCDEVL
jgi:hypothetical protein